MADIREEVLSCPECGRRHLDVGEWKTRPHHKHLCHYCGHIWRLDYYAAGSSALIGDGAVLEAHAHNRGYKAGSKAIAVPLDQKDLSWPEQSYCSAKLSHRGQSNECRLPSAFYVGGIDYCTVHAREAALDILLETTNG